MEAEPDTDADVLLSLPRALRAELKEPLGPVYTDAAELLADAGDPVVTVGDVVTYHLLRADRRPDVALVDGKTKREAVEDDVWTAIDGFDRRIEVPNPAATLSASLLAELRAALDRADAGTGTTVVVVDGEEDLAALPAVLAAPDGASVVYGQPDEGMVLAGATPERRAVVQDLLERMNGDSRRALEVLGVSPD
ncbi:MAG: GTP-dependent dephospho-CoA kinase family protein [Haloarculaceae archaeon]